MFRNAMPRYEILSEDALATLDGGWRRLVSEIGVEFGSDRALELFRQAGQKVEENVVPSFGLEPVAQRNRLGVVSACYVVFSVLQFKKAGIFCFA